MGISRVRVEVADDHLDKVSGVADELRNAGMTVERELTTLGYVEGTMEEDHIDRLRGVSGVSRAHVIDDVADYKIDNERPSNNS